MTEFNTPEPLYVGMDVDAELARCAEEDRLREKVAAATSTPAPRSSSRRRSLRDAIPALGKGSMPQVPLAA